MHRIPAIQVKEVVLASPLAAIMQSVAGQLASSSRKTYTVDVKHFARRMANQNLSLFSLSRGDLVAYRTRLAGTYLALVRDASGIEKRSTHHKVLSEAQREPS